tara:strand:- start:3 stop:548 length:546 start_codon:yes stop_codon:yes gene_type:complete
MNLKTINIHGKQYVEVNERIKYFRKHYTDWALESDIEKLEFITLGEKEYLMCVMKSLIKNPDGIIKATGTAYEILGSSNVNKTSFIENCETSANGRALGNLGIGIDNSIASADEVKIAIAQDKPKTKEKLNGTKYQAMIVAIGEGNIDVVEKRMDNYIMNKKQEKELYRLINEAKIASQSK